MSEATFSLVAMEGNKIGVWDKEDEAIYVVGENPREAVIVKDKNSLQVAGEVEVGSPFNNARLTAETFYSKTTTENEPIHMVGRVSELDDLQFIKIHEGVLMGYRKAGTGLTGTKYGASYGSVYYFKKIGEFNGEPVFFYLSDMVVHETKIKWVAGEFENRHDHPTQIIKK